MLELSIHVIKKIAVITSLLGFGWKKNLKKSHFEFSLESISLSKGIMVLWHFGELYCLSFFRIVFPHRKKSKKSDEIVHNKYILSSEVFEFGPLLVGRNRDRWELCLHHLCGQNSAVGHGSMFNSFMPSFINWLD